jgi:hypothetical protein
MNVIRYSSQMCSFESLLAFEVGHRFLQVGRVEVRLAAGPLASHPPNELLAAGAGRWALDVGAGNRLTRHTTGDFVLIIPLGYNMLSAFHSPIRRLCV